VSKRFPTGTDFLLKSDVDAQKLIITTIGRIFFSCQVISATGHKLISLIGKKPGNPIPTALLTPSDVSTVNIFYGSSDSVARRLNTKIFCRPGGMPRTVGAKRFSSHHEGVEKAVTVVLKPEKREMLHRFSFLPTIQQLKPNPGDRRSNLPISYSPC
jgi:hypothetical protein